MSEQLSPPPPPPTPIHNNPQPSKPVSTADSDKGPAPCQKYCWPGLDKTAFWLGAIPKLANLSAQQTLMSGFSTVRAVA